MKFLLIAMRYENFQKIPIRATSFLIRHFYTRYELWFFGPLIYFNPCKLLNYDTSLQIPESQSMPSDLNDQVGKYKAIGRGFSNWSRAQSGFEEATSKLRPPLAKQDQVF